MFNIHRTFSLSTGVKNNSIAVVSNGSQVDVVYHKTLVLSKRGRTITLRNGGWDTTSTRIVINNALEQLNTGAYLFRQKGETMISVNGVVKPFVSGMVIKLKAALSVAA